MNNAYVPAQNESSSASGSRRRFAEQQFNQADPDNRLVASELERRWEAASSTTSPPKRRFSRPNNTLQSHHTSRHEQELSTTRSSPLTGRLPQI